MPKHEPNIESYEMKAYREHGFVMIKDEQALKGFSMPEEAKMTRFSKGIVVFDPMRTERDIERDLHERSDKDVVMRKFAVEGWVHLGKPEDIDPSNLNHPDELIDAFIRTDPEALRDAVLAQEAPDLAENPALLRKQLENPAFLPSLRFVKQAFTATEGRAKGKRDSEAFFRFCETRKDATGEDIYVHEILTQEFIGALADHFSEVMIKNLPSHDAKEFVILEVGAGDGRLAGFLNKELQSRFGDRVKVIATDKSLKNVAPGFELQQMDYKMALDTFKPAIVLASWLTPQQDWTKDFRDPKRNIQEYVLIGEPDEGVSGTRDTWDQSLLEEDGFREKDLKAATEVQVSHTDHQSTVDRRNMKKGEYFRSRTLVFEKQEQPV